MPVVLLENLTKAYVADHPVVSNVDLRVEDGEFISIVGPSGSGKTTLLRLIAGLEKITSGRVSIDGRVVNGVPPKSRGISFVFQEGALYPHMTAGGNMAFPLRMHDIPEDEIGSRVDSMARTLGVDRQLDHRPGELAAGHRQGVATGRALLGGGRVLLMDEPLSNLDDAMKLRLRSDLMQMKRRHEPTVVYVTNDQSEAMLLADRVVVLRDGAVQQVDPPDHLYRHPVNVFVAGFIGTPTINLAIADLVGRADPVLQLGSRVIHLPLEVLSERPGLVDYIGDRVVIAIRPEHLHWGAVPDTDRAEQRVGGPVVDVEFLGHHSLVHVALDADAADGTPGVEFRSYAPGDVVVEVGRHAAFAVDVERLLFFDPGDGREIPRR